jgi:hypothetical protein
LPSVTLLTETPDPTGYGNNVAFQAIVTDSDSENNQSIQEAKLEVTPEGGSPVNYSMQVQASSADWADSNCNYRKALTFGNSASSQDLVDFPVLVKITSSRIDYSKTSSSDVRFYDADNSTLLPKETEEWDETGNSFVWVKVPQIDAGSTTDYIWAYYNCSDTNSDSASSVWPSSYHGVWHLEDATDTTVADSTSFGNTGTKQGSEPVEVESKIGKGQTYTSDCILTTYTEALNDFTIEIWFKDDGTASSYERIADKSYTNGFFLGRKGATASEFGGGIKEGGSPYGIFGTYPDGQWNHLVSVRNGTTHLLYGNGEFLTSNQVSSAALSTDVLGIGCWGTGSTSSQRFGGTIDEVRVSNVSRSTEWIEATFLSENDQFISFGSEEQPSSNEWTATLNRAFWQNGTYTYKVFGYDGRQWNVSSANQNFDVYVNFTKSIETEQDNYGLDEFVNLTVSSTASTGSQNWWNTTWTSRKPVTLSYTGDELTGFQVKVSVAYDSDMQADFDDLRFIDSDNSTALDHWRESYSSSSTANFWVEVPSIPNGGKTIWMYYGNAVASSASNGDNTFLFFDDFSDPTQSESDWNVYNGGPNYYLNFTGETAEMYSGGAYEVYALCPDVGLNDYVVEAKTKHVGSLGNMGLATRGSSGGNLYHQEIDQSTIGLFKFEDWGYTTLGAQSISVGVDTWYTVFFRVAGNSLYAYSYTHSASRSTTDSTFSSGRPGILTYSGKAAFDDFRVRKYAATQPSASIGSEEEYTAPQNTSVSKNWWNTGWSRRKPLTIENTGVALTNHQVFFRVSYDSNMKPVFGDLRFVDSDNSTRLDYWVEKLSPSSYADVWVEVPSLEAASNKTIWMYYGNAAAASASNGDNTFLFFDDFEDGSVSDWTVEADATLAIEPTVVKRGSYSGKFTHGGTADGERGAYKSFTALTEDFAMEYDMRVAQTNKYARIQALDGAPTGRSGTWFNFRDSGQWGWFNGSWNDVGAYNASQWYKLKYVVDLTSDEYSIYVDDMINAHTANVSLRDAPVSQVDSVYLLGYNPGGVFYVDNIFVRNYAENQPSVTSGSEEEYVAMSRIVNNGPTDASIYLLMQVYYVGGGSPVLDTTVVDDASPRTLASGQQLNLDEVFNGQFNTDQRSHGDGLYRIYVKVTDDSNNVLTNKDATSLVAYSQDITILSNRPPSITNPLEALTGTPGEPWTYDYDATDRDQGDTENLYWAISCKKDGQTVNGLIEINSSTGLMSATPTLAQAENSPYDITVTVYDDEEPEPASANNLWTYYVGELNAPTYSNDTDDSQGEVVEGTLVNASVYWSDETNLDIGSLTHNQTLTGNWTTEYYAFTSKNQLYNKTFDTSGYGGTTICWYQTANDTNGNLNWSMSYDEHCFTVIGNTAPTAFGVKMVPRLPSRMENLACSFLTTDSQSEILNAQVQWFKKVDGSWQHQTMFDVNKPCVNVTVCRAVGPTHEYLNPTDEWKCVVTAYDASLNATASANTTVLLDLAIIYTDGSWDDFPLTVPDWEEITDANVVNSDLNETGNCPYSSDATLKKLFYLNFPADPTKFIDRVKITDPEDGGVYQVTAVTVEKETGTYP